MYEMYVLQLDAFMKYVLAFQRREATIFYGLHRSWPHVSLV